MRKIIWSQLLAATVCLPIIADIVPEEGTPTVITPTVITPVTETPIAPIITPPIVTPTPAPSPAIPLPVVPAAITPPLNTVPALPVPAIPSQPTSLPYVPFSSSYIPVAPGSTTYYEPYGPGPGLGPSPLDARFNAPLGTPWRAPTAPIAPPAPIVVPGYTPGHRIVPLVPIPPQVRPIEHGHVANPTYLFPGLVKFSNNQWVGSDYLYNLPPTIGVAVELVVPSEISSTYLKEDIRAQVEGILSSYGITPFAQAFGDLPPLPFFHVIVFAVPVKNSYVLNVAGRLFEEVKLARLNYQLPGTWQAITWEKQELVVSAKGHVLDRLRMTIKDIAGLFASRFNHFNRLLLEQRDELSVQGQPIDTFTSPYLHQHSPCCSD